jgi:hypothetical protein
MSLRHGARLLVLFSLVLLVSRAADVKAPVVPADNPYAPAYAALAKLSNADNQALADGKPLSAEAAPVVAEVVQSLAAGRRAASVDWGLNYEAGSAMSLGYVGGIQRITRLALASTDKASEGGLVDRSLDVFALGRHAGSENLMITLLVERAIEQKAVAHLRKNLAGVSSAEAGRLLEGMGKLPPGGDFAEALQSEKVFFADALLREVRAALDSVAGDVSPGTVEALRMTGIISEGKSCMVGFETDEGAFWLKPGEMRQGVALLSVDRATDGALLTHKGKMLRLKLSSKQVSAVDFSRLARAIKAAPPGSVLEQLNADDVKDHGAEFVRMVELTSAQLGEVYQEAGEHPERFNDDEAFKRRLESLTPLARGAASMLPKIIARQRKAAEQVNQLRAELLAISQSAQK